MNNFRSHRNGTVGQAIHRTGLNARCSGAVCATSFRAEDTKKERNNSSMKTFSKITLAAAALALLGITALSTKSDDGRHSDARWKTIVIDVAVANLRPSV